MHTSLRIGEFVAAVQFPFYVLKDGGYLIISPGIPCKLLAISNNVCTLETPEGIGTIIRYKDWIKI